MQLAVIDNNQIVQIGESSLLFPNISFPVSNIDTDFLAEISAMEVIVWEMFDPAIEKLETVEPYIKDGKVYTCLKIAKTQQELDDDILRTQLAKENEVRAERNNLLLASDWTQVADAPVDKTAWAIYRQALRDITAQEGFPFNVIFPNPPL